MNKFINQVLDGGEYKDAEFERCAFLMDDYTLTGCILTDCAINDANVVFVHTRARNTGINNSIVKFEHCNFSNTDMSCSEFRAKDSKFTDIAMLDCVATTQIVNVKFRTGMIQLSAMGPSEAMFIKCDLANVQLSSDLKMRDCTKYECMDVHASYIGGRRYELSVDSNGLIRSGCRSFGRCSEAIDHWGNEKYKNPQRGRLYVALVKWLEEEGIVKL